MLPALSAIRLRITSGYGITSRLCDSVDGAPGGTLVVGDQNVHWRTVPSGPEREVESRSRIDGCFGPDAAAVAMNDALHGREADARAGKFCLAMQTLEWAEQLAGIAHVESGAVITDEIACAAPTVYLGGAELDTWGCSLGGEFPGIPEQIRQRNAYQVGIGVGDQAGL